MKRIGNLFDRICSMDNLILADKKARKDKKNRYGINRFDLNREENLKKLQEDLISGNFRTSKYTVFTIFEPKERVISRLPYYPDRIVHHAIMNVLEPIWVSIFTKDTYSCIKKRGIHLCAHRLKRDLRHDVEGTTYCLKLDIRKYYPSINHDVLKSIVRRKIKDNKLLDLLDEIIDSADGLPIGNYLSQYLSNLYLAYFDHYVKEKMRVKYYYRYADDIVILHNSKDALREYFKEIESYINSLKLTIKGNYQIFPVESRGIDYLGYVFYHDHVMMRKSIKKRMFRAISKEKDPAKMECRMAAWNGWMKHCDSKHLSNVINNKINESEFKCKA